MRHRSRLLDLVGSQRLACVLLVFLAISTWLGTLAQVELGLHATQQRYFESFALVHWLGPIPIPLPGANLVLTLLFVNLVVGGILRMRKRRANAGVLVAHVGIAILLLAGFVKHAFARDGHVTLFEGESAGWYESYYRYELSIARELEGGELRELVVPHEDLVAATAGRRVSVVVPELPFELELSSWTTNGRPARAGSTPGRDAIDGFVLSPRPAEHEAERNLGGLLARARFDDGSQRGAWLWSASNVPWTVAEPTSPAGERWAVHLRKERHPLPFRIALDDFRKIDHPRTAMPRSFESDVTIAAEDAGGIERPVRIRMNEPLRADGLVIYQASWGPAEAPPGTPLFSTFAVVENPADAWPLVGCIVIACGLALHFGAHLVRWLRRSGRRRLRAVGTSSTVAKRAAAVLAFIGLGATAHAADTTTEAAPDPPAWPPRLVERFESLPVQDGGRVKPLSTYASFTLLRLHGRRSLRLADGRRLSATEWLLDALLRSEHAARYPTFLVQDEAVVRALGLAPDRSKRDRWSYVELSDGVPRLFELAHEYARIESGERSRIEGQIVDLAGNVDTFLGLVRWFDFARYGVVVDDPELADLFPGRELASLGSILARAPELAGARHAAGSEVLDAAAEIASASHALALVPPGRTADEAWWSPADLAAAAHAGRSLPDAHLAIVRDLEGLWEARDELDALVPLAGELARATRALAGARGELRSVDLERAYYRLDPVGWSLRGFGCAFLFVALTWLRPRGRWSHRLAWSAATFATLSLGVAIVLRCLIRSRPPVSTLYETVLFVTATGAAVALFLEAIGRQRIALSAAAVLGLAGVFVANGYETLDGADTMPSLVAVLDTNFWLATHVTAITLGYSAGMLAALLASFWLVIDLFAPRSRRPGFLSDLGRMVYGVTCFALFFSLVGTILGGIWANDSWGRFWGWDPKENGALLIVITQTLILHGRLAGLLSTRGLCMAAAFGGTVVAFSWWGVNLLGVGLHSYGFTSGIRDALWTYYGLQWAVVALGARSAWRERSTNRAQERALRTPRQEANPSS